MTPQSIESRFITWRNNYSSLKTIHPIVMYQAIFALNHEFKGSLTFSADPMARKTLDDAVQIDTILRELAHDQKELSQNANSELHQILLNLKDLSVLRTYLGSKIELISVPTIDFTHFQRLPFTWDALSKARATSSLRHGLLFYERKDDVLLKELEERDRFIRTETESLGGIVVARLLEPRLGSGKDLRIQIQTLVGFPIKDAAVIPKEFIALTIPSNPVQ